MPYSVEEPSRGLSGGAGGGLDHCFFALVPDASFPFAQRIRAARLAFSLLSSGDRAAIRALPPLLPPALPPFLPISRMTCEVRFVLFIFAILIGARSHFFVDNQPVYNRIMLRALLA